MPASVQTQIEDAVVALIRGMQLAWPSSEQIQARRLPWHVHGDKSVVVNPGITVFPLGSSRATGTNIRDNIGYGAGIAFICPTDQATGVNRNRIPDAKEKVRRKLETDRFTIDFVGADYYDTTVQDAEVNIPKEGHRYEVSGLTLRCWIMEPRT